MSECRLCPRQCRADRTLRTGFCGGGTRVRVARAAPHFWEEPCISGQRGSGAVFFSGCSLRCCFCQNYPISAENYGREISVERLAEIFRDLESQRVHNLNLVNPTHWQPRILEALSIARPGIPVVWNSGGYELEASVKALEGRVDIFLPDLKFFDPGRAQRYADAPDYFFHAGKAILEMIRQTGPCRFDENGVLLRGTVVRHLVLPKGREDSKRLLSWLAANVPAGSVRVSLMSQYTPFHRAGEFPEINRRLSTFEYADVVNHAVSLGLDGYMQERSSAKEEYTPPFDLTGV